MSSTSPEGAAPKQQERRVAIVGSAPSSMMQAPYDDPSWEIWGLAWRQDMPRCDMYFDIHALTSDRKHILGNSVAEYIAVMKQRNKPHMLQEEVEGFEHSIRYPLVEVLQDLRERTHGQFDGKYLSCSIAYMLAYAMYCRYPVIALYGVDLIDDTEYVYQRPNMEYLIGIATAHGHKVEIPDNCALLGPSWLYGYSTPPHQQSQGAITEEILKNRIEQYQKKKDHYVAALHTADGAIQECQQLIQMLKHVRRGVK